MRVGEIELEGGPLHGLSLCVSEPRRHLFIVERAGGHGFTRQASGAIGVYVAVSEYERACDWEPVVVLRWRAVRRASATGSAA